MRLTGWGALWLAALAGCGAYVEDPACWENAGGTFTFPAVNPGVPASLYVAIANRCDRPVEVIRVTLSALRCEGDCPAVTLASTPELPVRISPGGALTLVLQATATGMAGHAEALLVATTGEADAPENQVWTVVAETAAR